VTLGDDIVFAPVRELKHHLAARRVSSVELTEAYLRRLETIGPKLGAVVTITRELALEQAPRADEARAKRRVRGPLHGIPYGAKDLLATKGIPTTWGAEPYREQVFDYDATVITRLREAGAVLVAKLAMVELAGGMGYNKPGRQLHRSWPFALEHRPLERRLLERLRRGHGRGAGGVCHRLRDLGLDPHPRLLLRALGFASHLRPGFASRRHGLVLDAG